MSLREMIPTRAKTQILCDCKRCYFISSFTKWNGKIVLRRKHILVWFIRIVKVTFEEDTFEDQEFKMYDILTSDKHNNIW